MKTLIILIAVVGVFCFIGMDALAHYGSCGVGDDSASIAVSKTKGTKSASGHMWEKGTSCFGDVCSVASEKGGVKEITYDQFQKIRNSGEKYVLVDVLSAESYANGHIDGAISFPYEEINIKTAFSRLNMFDNIIVYCGGFKCSASTKAANRLIALGYEHLVDYKGGLEEWQAKGNKLVK